MYPAVISAHVLVIPHVRGLRVFAQDRIVVGRTGGFHRAQRLAVHAFSQQPFADQPISFGGCLPQRALLDEHPEHVRDRLVQRAGLIAVDQVSRVLRDAVGQFVADHVDGDGKAIEQALIFRQCFVAVAIHHLLAVPEGVVVVVLIVHRGIQAQAFAVHRIAHVDIVIQVIRCAGAVIGFIHSDVGGGRIPLAAHLRPGQAAAVVRRIDGAFFTARNRLLYGDCAAHGHSALLAQNRRDRDCLLGPGLLLNGTVSSDLGQHIRGQDAMNRMEM